MLCKGDIIHLRIILSQLYLIHDEVQSLTSKSHKTYVTLQTAGSTEVAKTSKAKNSLFARSASTSSLRSEDSDSDLTLEERVDQKVANGDDEQNDSVKYYYEDEIVFPPLTSSLSVMKVWLSLYKKQKLRKDILLAEGDLIIQGEDIEAVNKEKSITITLRSVKKQEIPKENLKENSTNDGNNNTQQKNTDKSVGSITVLLKIERDEDTATLGQFEDEGVPHKIQVGNWNSEQVHYKNSTVATSPIIIPPSDDMKYAKYNISKNMVVFLPEDNWKLHDVQCVNKDLHSHYRGEFWSKRCLGTDTSDIELISVVYQKVCSKTKEDFLLAKNLLENMIYHYLEADAMQGLKVITKGQDMTPTFGNEAFDSVSLYHVNYTKRNFTEIDTIFYIVKPKGLNVMLCFTLITSFGVSETEFKLLENVIKSAVIIYQ
ncbi:hypothetical protein ABK040_013469 [Willaertia magna]